MDIEKIIQNEVRRLMKTDSTNQKLWDLDLHKRFLNYRVKEFESKDVLIFTKLEWLAAGMPYDPIKKTVPPD